MQGSAERYPPHYTVHYTIEVGLCQSKLKPKLYANEKNCLSVG